MRCFDELQPELSRYDISVIALSKDTVDEAAVHKERDNLSIKLLSDPKLKVIRQYGVEHHKAFGFKTGSFSIFGVPFAFPPSFKAMAIPTTLLVDENGTVRWIDQADDYRIRSNGDRVMSAVREVFG